MWRRAARRRDRRRSACKPAGAPSTASGTGSAHCGVGPSANSAPAAPAGAATSTMTRGPFGPVSRRTERMASAVPFAERGLFGTCASAAASAASCDDGTAGERQLDPALRPARTSFRRSHSRASVSAPPACQILRHDVQAAGSGRCAYPIDDTAGFRQTLRRRPQDLDLFDVLRPAEVELRRHARNRRDNASRCASRA